MKRILVLVLSLLTVVVDAASQDVLTIERLFGSRDFTPDHFTGQWMPDGRSWSEIDVDSLGRSELWRINAATGTRTRLIAADELNMAYAARPITIESVSFSKGGQRILIFTAGQQVWRERTKGLFYVFDVPTRKLLQVSQHPGWQMFAKFSPDASRVVFARDNDLFVTDLDVAKERQLTFDGSDTIINGTSDWVYEEEFGLRDAFSWSPDGSRILYWRFDQSDVPVFNLVDETGTYPTNRPVRYPKAGESNSSVRIGVLDLASGSTTWLDVQEDGTWYIPRAGWADLSGQIWVQRMNRHQNRLEVLLADPQSGEAETLFVESDSAWVDVDDDLVVFDGGDRLLWTSDRDGFNHVYVFDRAADRMGQLTEGPWDVSHVSGFDQATRTAFITAARESPLRRGVFAVPIEGDSELRPLAAGTGLHFADFSPTTDYWVDAHTVAGTPGEYVLRDREGIHVRTLVDNSLLRARLDSLRLQKPEFLHVDAEDGSSLNAYIIKPPDFDATRVYPLLLYMYNGPGSQTVLDGWRGYMDFYLWHQHLAQRGILVASVDGRGTGARGRHFKKQTYLKLGVLEAADQLAAIRQLGSLPFVDANRIAVWGDSYGGFVAQRAALLSKGAIKAAISLSGVTDWRLYDTIYTERYMRTPRENPRGYETSAPLTLAERLEASLLLIHGTGDDNVHPQHTLQMADALEKAGKQFRMHLYPNGNHWPFMWDNQVHLFELMEQFLVDELLEPRATGK